MPGKPPFALLAEINKMLVNAGYPKEDGPIVKRLAQALADRGKDPGLQPRIAAFIRERRSEIEWTNETWSPAVKAARADEVDQFERFMVELLGIGVIDD